MIIHLDTTRFIWEVLENQEYSPIFKDLVVMDLGCNVGAFSLWIYPNASRIFAIDKDERNIDLFRQTIRDNELQKVSLYCERVKNLQQFMSGHAVPIIDVRKIDIEGDEIDVFQNDFPKDRIRSIVGEYHGVPVQGILESLGYRYFEYPNQHFVARL